MFKDINFDNIFWSLEDFLNLNMFDDACGFVTP